MRVAPRTLVILGLVITAVLIFVITRSVVLDNDGASAARAGDETPAPVIASSCSEGRSIHVAPDGVPSASGTTEQPLDLTTALSATSPAKPCDTIWLRGGTYSGTFAVAISGTETAPIVIRAQAGERPIIDTAPSIDPGISLNTSYVHLWGIEITNSDPQRTSAQAVNWPSDIRRGTGVLVRGSGLKLINLVIHDLARAIDVEPEAMALEMYGNLVFSNGWDGPEASQGNGIETQNQGARQVIADNVIFNQYSHGILALGSEAVPVNNLTIEGNVVFNNGLPGRSGFTRDVLVGGGKPVTRVVLRENMTYGGAQTFVGFGSGCQNTTIENNYLVGSTPLVLEKCTPVLQKNTLSGQYGFGALPKTYPDNQYEAERPRQTVVRYRSNRYEPGRAHVIVYNWEKGPAASIDLTKAGLASGDAFEIVDVQNYQAEPLVKGVVPANGTVDVAMTNLKAMPPTGHPGPIAHTAPEFAVFLVRKQDAQRSASTGTP
jgi:hypothetical protein